MFYVLSKVLGFFAIPSNLIIGLGLIGAALACTRFARTGVRISIASLVLLAFIGFSPVGNALIIPLEERFPPWDSSRGAPDGIVVLGGGIDPDLSAAHGRAAFLRAADRIVAA